MLCVDYLRLDDADSWGLEVRGEARGLIRMAALPTGTFRYLKCLQGCCCCCTCVCACQLGKGTLGMVLVQHGGCKSELVGHGLLLHEVEGTEVRSSGDHSKGLQLQGWLGLIPPCMPLHQAGIQGAQNCQRG